MDILKITNSTQIIAVAYDAQSPALYVEFLPTTKGRSVYRYADAMPSLMDNAREIAQAGGSVGKWFAANVKPVFGAAEVRKLTAEEIAVLFPTVEAAQ